MAPLARAVAATRRCGRPKLTYERIAAAQRPDRAAASGSVDADRPRPALVSRRLEGRTRRAHRLRAPLRAHDVQGLEERRAGAAHLDRLVGRRTGQRLHDRRRDGVLADGAVAVPAAGALDGSRSHGDAAHRRQDVPQRARSGEGRAPHAHREPAVRAAQRDPLRPGVHRAPLQAPGDRQHAGSRGGDDRRCARLLSHLLRAGQLHHRHRRRLRRGAGEGADRSRIWRACRPAAQAVPRDIPKEPIPDEGKARHRDRAVAAAGGGRRRITSPTTGIRTRIRCTSRRRCCPTARARASTASSSTKRASR